MALGLATLALGLTTVMCIGLPGCGGSAEAGRNPWIVIGIDGADGEALERLWGEGELPNLRALAEAGVYRELGTKYSRSPLIWTTIATGVTPSVHGIDDFVTLGPGGEVIPVTSDQRKVPALWSMASGEGLRVAVLGWWATWPVEEVSGVMVSDRATRDVDRRIWPAEKQGWLDRLARQARQDESPFPGHSDIEVQDRVVAAAAEELAGEEWDLMLLYLRSVDIQSHRYWHAWDPEAFDSVDPQLVERDGDRVARAYRDVDRTVGAILAAAPESSNVLVVSDHGFEAGEIRPKIIVDVNQILQRLGLLQRDAAGDPDPATSFVTSHHQSGDRNLLQYGRAAESMADADRRTRLEENLRRVTYASGRPVFEVRSPWPKDRAEGADLVAQTAREGVSETLLVDGEPQEGLLRLRGVVSGTHGEDTHGILIAKGPDYATTDEIESIDIHDLGPTLAYGLGLPVARDAAGRVVEELFAREFRRANPTRWVDTWGSRQRDEVKESTTSKADEDLVEELEALGYIEN